MLLGLDWVGSALIRWPSTSIPLRNAPNWKCQRDYSRTAGFFRDERIELHCEARSSPFAGDRDLPPPPPPSSPCPKCGADPSQLHAAYRSKEHESDWMNHGVGAFVASIGWVAQLFLSGGQVVQRTELVLVCAKCGKIVRLPTPVRAPRRNEASGTDPHATTNSASDPPRIRVSVRTELTLRRCIPSEPRARRASDTRCTAGGDLRP